MQGPDWVIQGNDIRRNRSAAQFGRFLPVALERAALRRRMLLCGGSFEMGLVV
jgi:hypothetical protein